MIAEAIPPPVLVEIPFAIIGIALVCTFVAVLGLKKAYAYTLGAILSTLANNLRIDAWRIHINLGGVFDRLNDKIEAGLASALFATETALGKWWYAQKRIVEWTFDSMAWSWTQLAGAFDNLVSGTIPDTVNLVVRPVRTNVASIQRALRAEAARLEARIIHRAQAIEAQLEHDFGLAWRGIDALRREIPRQIGRAVNALEGDVAALGHKVNGVIPRRLTRLEKLLGVGVLSGIAVAALTRVFGFWQCSNVRRLARGVCRMDTNLLDMLLLETLAIVGAISIVEFAKALQVVTDEIAGEVTGFIAESREAS